MNIRLVVLTLVFLLAGGAVAYVDRPEVVALRSPLAELPFQFGEWRGRDGAPFDNRIVTVLGVDEYLNRAYMDSSSKPIGLYIGYYQSQRAGDTMHSPLNCLPGAGWQPATTARAPIEIPGRAEPAVVNRILIEKGLDRQLVLYWYQSHGRIIASEYASKAYLLFDAARLNRSDAAMVRVISPVLPGEIDDRAAFDRAATFTKVLLPRLEAVLPS